MRAFGVPLAAALVFTQSAATARRHDDAPERRPRWHVGDEVPEGFHTETRRRSELATFGGMLAGVPYALGALLAIDYHDRDARWLWAPLAGPLIYARVIADRGDARYETAAILLLDFTAQVTGTILAIVGASTHSTRLVKNDVSLGVAPFCSSSGCTVAAVGTF
jgi:hypothetical protein